MSTHASKLPTYRALVATSPADLRACFRLRHQIYVERAKVVPPGHAMVRGDELIDAYDDYSTQILLLADERPVGTARITSARSGPLEIEAYRANLPITPRHHTCEVTRLMVLDEWRSMLATGELLYTVYQTLDALDVHRLLAAGKLGSLGRYYQNFGLRVVDDEPFAYGFIQGAKYRVLLGDFGKRRSLKRLGWNAFFESSYWMLATSPALISNTFRRGLSEKSKARAIAKPLVELAAST